MDLKNRIFWIAGNDYNRRQQTEDNIKKKLLAAKSASLSVLVFYAKETKPDVLKEKLLNFSFDKERVVTFKDFLKFSQESKDLIFENFKRLIGHNYIIVETDEDFSVIRKDKKSSTDKLTGMLLANSQQFTCAMKPEFVSLGAFSYCVERGDWDKAFYILEKLLEGGPSKEKEFGPQIVGVLSRLVSRLSNSDKKKAYLQYLWEADRAIKEKGLNVTLALQVLLTKLKLS